MTTPDNIPISFPSPELSGVPILTPPPQPSSILDDNPEDEQSREDAFSDVPQWNGQLLHPFSVERYGIFVSQRVAMGAPSLYDALRDGSAFFPDAVRILWLCSHLPALLARMRRDPEAMQEAMDTWAETSCPVHRGADAVAIAIGIFNSANENRHATRREGGLAPAANPLSGN